MAQSLYCVECVKQHRMDSVLRSFLKLSEIRLKCCMGGGVKIISKVTKSPTEVRRIQG